MKKITFIKSLSFLIAFFCALNFGFGQMVIYENSITGTNPQLYNPYIFGQAYELNINVSGIGRGPGVLPHPNTNDRYTCTNWLSPTLDVNKYYELTLIPNANFAIDFTSFVYTSESSPTGPTFFALRSSLDGFNADIGLPLVSGTTIDLTSAIYQNLTSATTFRLYAWGATDALGTFSINNFSFNGLVTATCSLPPITWTSGGWVPASGPTINTPVIISEDYNTAINGNFTACSLTVNSGFNLTVSDGTYVEIENDAIIDGTITVETRGNFVQNDDGGTFSVNPATGTASVNKQTPVKNAWYYYTYWSSPVIGETIGDAFPFTDGDRRFWFNATNFNDNDGNDIDDNNNDWQYALGGDVMVPGVGYAATAGRFHIPGATDNATFEGEFNTGDVDVNITFDPTNAGIKWNFIGNPYPSAIDFIAFQAANSAVIDGTAYFWSQASPFNASNPGNQQLNFNLNDYAVFTVGTGGAAGGVPTEIPNGYIASGQSFFIPAITIGTATFTNAMRMADNTSNNQFFKSSNIKKTNAHNDLENRLWINLTSDNGVFNQILVGYVDNATDANDGLYYDAPKLINQDYAAVLYTSLKNDDKKYVIQGKNINSITKDEVIKLGYNTKIKVPTLYKLSIAQLQGNFLTGNTIYLKDSHLNKLHDLSAGDYTFTSETGEFNDRFEIVFNASALSTDEVISNEKLLRIVELKDGQVQFNVSNNLKIASVGVFDLLGRQLYQFKGQNSTETYKLSNLRNTVYVAKVTLSNGVVITKKTIKR